MKLLLDTHLLLWAAGETEKLSGEAKNLLSDMSNELLFSSASLWEIAIKRGKGRPDLVVEPRVLRRNLRENNYIEVPITSDHAMEVEHLPGIHADPFDRILIAQAIVEGIQLLTTDNQVARYQGPILKV